MMDWSAEERKQTAAMHLNTVRFLAYEAKDFADNPDRIRRQLVEIEYNAICAMSALRIKEE